MQKLISIFTLLLLGLWVAFLALGAGPAPALGPMLALRGGVWDHSPQRFADQKIPGLKEPVTVTIDKNGVPHIFARGESDLYRTQGFLMASQRLFQMDLMTRITDGTLSEWFGERTAKTDDFFVRFGMRESARKDLERFSKDAHTKMLLEAFADGVNAYIDSAESLPAEYKVLNIRPKRFTPLHVMHMGKQLTFGLAGRSYDVYLSRIQQVLGTAKTLDLFPQFDMPDLDDFVVPSKGKKILRAERVDDFPFVTKLGGIPFFPLPAAGNGSNNWAVSAKKSTTGFSLMANDTHLGHTLPNIWWETQLSTPGFNVYGVALVAVPGIINGFNKDLAWGPTNGTLDVLDYYEIEFENETSNRYKYGDQWLEPQVQMERIHIRRGKSKDIAVLWTKYGVVLHREQTRGLAMSWTGHQTDDELKAIRGLFAAQTIDECMKSFSSWAAPVQNFICADKTDVAIQHSGFLPERKIGEGRFIMDGRGTLATPFAKSIADSKRPRIVRPAEGFVFSANQRVTDAGYPYYMGWDFEDPFRAITIRRRLNEKEKYSPEDLVKIQNDAYELPAELALPLMLQALTQLPDEPEMREAIQALKKWDLINTPDSFAAAVFKAWFESFATAIFADEFAVQSKSFRPKDPRFIQLLRRVLNDPKDSDSQWVDNKETKDKIETLSDAALTSLYMAWSKMTDRMGKDHKQWNFKKWNRARMEHAGRLPGFGSGILDMAGSADSIRGNAGAHGAVYKIVVALGEWPKAWIQVPGGNSGDPFSRAYERFVTDWAAGQMRDVEYYRDLSEAESRAAQVIHFTPTGAK